MKLRIRYEDTLPVNAFRWTPRPGRETMHFHDSLEIGCCRQGRGTFLFSDKSYPVGPGDLFVVNNLELHMARADVDDPCQFTFLNFDSALPLAEDELLLMPFAYHPQEFSNRIEAGSAGAQRLAGLVEQVYDEMLHKRNGYRSAARASILLLCVELLRRYAGSLEPEAWTRLAKSFGKKRDLLLYMEQHYHYPIELADLAKYLGTTESAASRIFHEAVGRTFREHLSDLRVQDAKRRLLATDASVTDICFASGFQSIPSFYRQFHQAAGLAPQDYRLRNPVGTIFSSNE